MQILWFPRKGYYCSGEVLLKNELGFYKVGYSSYSPKDIESFSWYAYVYRRIRDGLPTHEWCVQMDDGSYKEIEEAKDIDRQI